MSDQADFVTRLPATWWEQFAGATLVAIETGMSEARLWRLDHGRGSSWYLKVAEGRVRAELRREIERTRWLADHHMRVPTILRVHEGSDFVAFLSHAVPGVVATHAEHPPAILAAAIGRGLAKLHALAVADCPFDETLRTRFARARRLIRDGEIDAANFDERNRNLAPQGLLDRLCERRPVEELVVTHGDATLSNIIVDHEATIGFVDCGHCGKADRYLDLALMAQELEETFGRAEARTFAAAYGESRWNAVKARFFADLYELF
ncbi:MAG: aminoglycoside 3'-phosphotransferase [Hyphomicrobiales bacterium]|nr:aminoglycoside 3'-phosphotransferase [Hyphomicrobiales bacterium]MBV9516775.1 aminoglycoside 3'-phosphotransferase [Hyphomicrobiales bacterium]